MTELHAPTAKNIDGGNEVGIYIIQRNQVAPIYVG